MFGQTAERPLPDIDYEREFNRQLREKIRLIEKVDSSREMTAARHDIEAWWHWAATYLLVEPKRVKVIKWFNLMIPQFREWHRSLGWSDAQKRIVRELDVVSTWLVPPAMLAIPAPARPADLAPTEEAQIEKEKAQLPSEEVRKIPWGWITAGGVTALAVGFALPRLKK